MYWLLSWLLLLCCFFVIGAWVLGVSLFHARRFPRGLLLNNICVTPPRALPPTPVIDLRFKQENTGVDLKIALAISDMSALTPMYVRLST